jgi:hypothetical protein
MWSVGNKETTNVLSCVLFLQVNRMMKFIDFLARRFLAYGAQLAAPPEVCCRFAAASLLPAACRSVYNRDNDFLVDETLHWDSSYNASDHGPC